MKKEKLWPVIIVFAWLVSFLTFLVIMEWLEKPPDPFVQRIQTLDTATLGMNDDAKKDVLCAFINGETNKLPPFVLEKIQ